MHGIALRDEGIATVKQNADEAWKALYRAYAVQFINAKQIDDTFLGEDLRRALEPQIGKPHHPNAWGAMARSSITRWIKDGFVEIDGMGHAKDAKSHASLLPRYRVVK